MVDTLTTQFIGQSIHFGVNIFAALACLAAAWLYLDAWIEGHHLRELTKGGGFLVLAAGFLLTGAAWGNPGVIDIVANTLKLIGYGCIAWGHIIDPLMVRPKTVGYLPAFTITTSQLAGGLNATLPLAAFAVSFLYARRALTGLENHLKPPALAFGIFGLAELIALSSWWQHASNPLLQPLGAPFGLPWWLQHAILVAATFVLSRWVWRYLAKRLLTELFLSLSSLTFALVLAATVSVSALLLGSLQHDALSSLQTATKVLGYAVDSKTADTRTDAEVLAQNPDVIQAADQRDHTGLASAAGSLLVQKQLSEVMVTDETGVVLARASDPERYGDSLSDDPLIQHALVSGTASSLTPHSGTLAPTLVITTASPIRSQGHIIGLALASLALDNSFVDGLKHTTGLDSTVYSGAGRAATTLTTPGSPTRSLGVKETNTAVLTRTLKQGQIWQGALTITGQPFLAVYFPLKDINNSVVGMLAVGEPQSAVFQTVEQAIRLTFLGAALSLILIMMLVYVVARQISRQLH